MILQEKNIFTSKSKKLCLHHVFYHDLCLYAVLFLLTQPQFYLFWRMGNRCILIHRNVFWPNAQAVICLQCCRISLCSNWGEASEKKTRRGRNIAGKILLVGRIKSFIRQRPIKCAVLFGRFVSEIYESMV